jgi:hypothetical protein
MRRQGAVSVHRHAEEVVFLGLEKLSEEERKLPREQSKGFMALQYVPAFRSRPRWAVAFSESRGFRST